MNLKGHSMANDSVISNIDFTVERKENGRYEIAFHVSDGWYLRHVVNDSALQRIIDDINDARGVSSVMKLFNCNEEQATELLKKWGEIYRRSPREECKNCKFKRKECFKCTFICQSPLEQAMFLEFRNRDMEPILQRRIRKDGSFYDYPEEVDSETILTIPDFYFENDKTKVCVYADGKTYHYNNEYQGIRDRSIDIALQNLGYKVLRYTGSQIRNDLTVVIDGIIESMK